MPSTAARQPRLRPVPDRGRGDPPRCPLSDSPHEHMTAENTRPAARSRDRRYPSDARRAPAAGARPGAPTPPSGGEPEDALERAAAVLKPRMRGWLHAGVFPLALAGGIVLITLARSAAAVAAFSVYALSACLLFGTSALYHRGTWGPRGEAVLRRLDHANIFLIIAGTYTPLTLLLLPEEKGRWLLWGIWAAALAGILFRVFWVGAPRWLYTPCCTQNGDAESRAE